MLLHVSANFVYSATTHWNVILQLLWKSNSCPLIFSSSSASQHASLASSPVVQFELLAIPAEWQLFENHALSIIKVNTNDLFYCWSPLVSCECT